MVYSFDAKKDILSLNPVCDDVIDEVVDGSMKSMLVVKIEHGIRTVSICIPPEESEGTCEVCDSETRTGDLAMHGSDELLEITEVEKDDMTCHTRDLIDH